MVMRVIQGRIIVKDDRVLVWMLIH